MCTVLCAYRVCVPSYVCIVPCCHRRDSTLDDNALVLSAGGQTARDLKKKIKMYLAVFGVLLNKEETKRLSTKPACEPWHPSWRPYLTELFLKHGYINLQGVLQVTLPGVWETPATGTVPRTFISWSADQLLLSPKYSDMDELRKVRSHAASKHYTSPITAGQRQLVMHIASNMDVRGCPWSTSMVHAQAVSVEQEAAWCAKLRPLFESTKGRFVFKCLLTLCPDLLIDKTYLQRK